MSGTHLGDHRESHSEMRSGHWPAFSDPICPLQARFDQGTGMLAGISFRDGRKEQMLPVSVTVQLTVGGVEQRGPTGGLVYVDALTLQRSRLIKADARTVRDADRITRSVTTELEQWRIVWHWALRREAPWLSLALEVEPPDGDHAPLRNLTLTIDTQVSGEDWCLQVPGNPVNPGARLDSILRPLEVSPPAGLCGSSGLIALTTEEQDPLTFALWPFSWTEIAQVTISAATGGLRTTVGTGLAGDPPSGTAMAYSGLFFHLEATEWRSLLGRLPEWYAAVGLQTPAVKPDWAKGANIYEVQIGCSVFAKGFRYAPYPQLQDLLGDLDRIHQLGFDTLQVMPRQPYPSYNVHAYEDITTTYGDEMALRTLVERCHERGMRVVLDVLMHGVLDRKSIAAAADGVRSGPFKDRLSEESDNVFGDDEENRDAGAISWSRHILDFEPYWRDGSPEAHPLVTEHPDWFCRGSDGNIIGVYTEAFDLANPEWQDYFCRSMEMLVRRLGVDGFRFDAPTYNNFPNWSEKARSRASASTLGCVSLFRQLRPRLKTLDHTLMMYTEPSGVVLRESMDLNYNYDEQWLVAALLGPPPRPGEIIVDGAGLARWLAARDAALPPGSLTAHHVDSHDTFWWPLPGRKWRREQFGIEATRAVMWAFALCGGAFMMFVGGEEGIEEDLRRTLQLRRSRAELRDGEADYGAVSVNAGEVFAVVRRAQGQALLVLVNLSSAGVRSECTLHREKFPLAPRDMYHGRALPPAEKPSTLLVDLPAHEVMLIEIEQLTG